MLSSWPELFREDPRVRALAAELDGAPGAPVRAGSLYGSAQALLLASIRRLARGPILAIALGVEEADELALDLATFGADGALRFPAWEALPARDAHPNFAILADRLALLRSAAHGELAGDALIVAPIGAVLQPVPDAETVRRAAIPIRRGEDVPPELLEQAFSRAGFERVPMVELPGEWSRRGGIVDVFPLGPAGSGARGPFRVEYFGDTVDSIREIDPESQRSLRELESVELLLSGVGELFRGTDALRRSILDFLPPETIVAILEPARVEGMAVELFRRFGPGGAYLAPEVLLDALPRHRRLEVSALPFEGATPLETRSVERAMSRKIEEVAIGLRSLAAEPGPDGATIVTLLAAREAERGRIRELLAEQGLAVPEAEAPRADSSGAIEVEVGEVARGFHAPSIGRAVLTSRELFHETLVRRPAPRPRARKKGAPIASFLELSPGDHVVHVVHGIGRFLGIERLSASPEPGTATGTGTESKRTGGRPKEYLSIEYAEGTIVYVPATKIELVQRYVGAGGLVPHLSKIGTAGWQKGKERVKAAVLDLAAELLEVQAARDLKQGFAFPEDESWQAAFEASFPYEDTPDQAEATARVRDDMQAPRPMDRLICGDVGYGKTEIAMRAAFRAALAKKQVAVLVPTTILAEQHQETFRARMSEFPLRVECVNRFRSGREIRRILSDAQKGAVDILIGTHRLLSEDVRFKDLGLVILDEEQRFGVVHKERLKRVRRTVDVLTLTATPIPRTLHMSLLGLKDISALETPPAGRLAIETIIARDEPRMVREAILRELAREGQVYFVHNRVQSIGRRAEELEKLVPEARFAVVHGQMDEDALESRMLAFVKGVVDVLVTTTIIESGVDIPRANTIFIDRADHFGLADLHQLRGRVGRYTHRAYAYLLLPRDEAVSEVAERRLKAIEEFNELGAGFRIAMRDLEIRGAGNILGPEQSGHIAAVGYDLYCKLLKEAIGELEGRRATRAAMPASATPAGTGTGTGTEPPEPPLPVEGVEIELDLAAHIPDRYVPDTRQKIEAYRKLASAHDVAALAAAEAELRDRFGPLPEPARTLVDLCRLRIACERCGVHRVSAEGKVAVLRHSGDGRPLKLQLAYARAKALWPEPGTAFVLISEKPGLPDEEVLARLIGVLGLTEACASV